MKHLETLEESPRPIPKEEQEAEELPIPEIPKPPIIEPVVPKGPDKNDYKLSSDDDIMDISKF